MLDIEKLKLEIVELLKPLDPDRVILFGSYAYGTPNEDSDIDLLLVKNLEIEKAREYRVSARKKLRELIRKHNIGFDIIAANNEFLNSRDDYFYKVDILQNGKVIYVK
jgi:predicted nucleotidyltransferase